MIYLTQQTTEGFRHFGRILFSRNFAYETLAKISEFTVLSDLSIQLRHGSA